MIAFDNSYARLPAAFYARVLPAPFAAPKLIRLNHALAAQLGLDPDFLASPEGVELLAGQQIPANAAPLAMAYAGHQFGHFVPQLGDGRAILLGEVIGRDGARRDLHLKGAGPTPYSRNGDGFAALGPVLREYLVSEAMAALGIPTTRALAALTTGARINRETSLPGAVLLRVAASHIRVGTFQYFAARQDIPALRQLADHAIARHYPRAATAPQPYLAFLEAVIIAQAELIASWLLVGFIHGVMNTDNMSVSGETIDYGPCAFMDAYDPATVFSSIDEFGRYAYGRQPAIAQWNLTRLAEALLPLLSEDGDAAVEQAKAALALFSERFNTAYLTGLRHKLGLREARAGEDALAQDLLQLMAANQADFTLTFRRLCDAAETPQADSSVAALFQDPAAFTQWAQLWHARLAEEARPPNGTAAAMRRLNPAFIPRNHRVEAAITAAVTHGDFAPFETLLAVLAKPYEDQPVYAIYAQAPPEGACTYRTFCGT